MCALHQNLFRANVKSDETVDMALNVEYNYLENSLRIVCWLREAHTLYGLSVSVSSGAQGGQCLHFQTTFKTKIYYERGKSQ